MSGYEPDDLMRALADLRLEEPDAARSRAILAAANRTLTRHRPPVEPGVTLLAIAWARGLVPLAAGALSAAFIASAVAQAVVVLARSGAHVFLAP